MGSDSGTGSSSKANGHLPDNKQHTGHLKGLAEKSAPRGSSYSPEQAQANWEDLKRHLTTWFHQPDLMAVRAALATGMTQSWLDEQTVWLFAIGPSGCGKSAVIHNISMSFPNAFYIGDLTPQTFMSGYQDPKDQNKKSHSLLHLIKNGLICFKDLSTFLEKNDKDRAAIAAQLREIADGSYGKVFGTGKAEWEGKITCIACTTPAIDHQWAVLREMGDRFLGVRWQKGRDYDTTYMAIMQTGMEGMIFPGIKKKAEELHRLKMAVTRLHPIPTPQFCAQVTHLATLCATLRTPARRTKEGFQVPRARDREAPTRLGKCLIQLARGHAALFRRESLNDEDYQLAHRVGMDSVPPLRREIFAVVAGLDARHPGLSAQNIQQRIEKDPGITPKIVQQAIDELVAVGAVEKDRDVSIGIYRVSHGLRESVAGSQGRLLTEAEILKIPVLDDEDRKEEVVC